MYTNLLQIVTSICFSNSTNCPVCPGIVMQLLDCFVIPVLMVLSWFLLKTRYRPVHFVAVIVCLVGVGAMVGADLMAGRDQGSSKFCVPYGLFLFCATVKVFECHFYSRGQHFSFKYLPLLILGKTIFSLFLCFIHKRYSRS